MTKLIENELNLEHIADQVVYTARKILSREGYLMPVIFLCKPDIQVLKDGTKVPVTKMYTKMLSFKDRRDKYREFAEIKELCKVNSIVGFVFLTEAWAASQETDFNPETDKLPSEREDKKEIVLVNAGYLGGSNFTWFFDIKEKHGVKTLGSKQKAGEAINNLTAELLDYLALN